MQLNNYARTRQYLVGLSLFIAVLVAHLYLTSVSPYLDEGDHANTGRLLAHGRLIYQDAFNEKGPGLYWITAGLFTVFGDRFAVMRHAAASGMLASLLLIFALAWKYGRPNVGLAAGAIFAAFHLFLLGEFWQSESLLTPLALAVWYLLSSDAEGDHPAPWKFAAAGLALYVATCVKQTAWWLVLGVVAATLIEGRANRAWAWFKSLLAFGGGLAAPWALTLLMVRAQGNWGPFVEGYLFPLTLFGWGAYVEGPGVDDFFLEAPAWWMTAAALIAVARKQMDLPSWDRSVFSAVLCAVVLMVTQALFAHHFLPVLAIASVGFSAAVLSKPRVRRWPLRPVLLVGFLALAVAAAGYMPDRFRYRVARFDAGDRQQVAARVTATTSPDDPVFVFPHDSTYYYLTHREPPGRYGFLLPWTTPPLVLDRVQAEFAARPPALILYTYLANCTPTGMSPAEYLAPFLHRLTTTYRLEQIFPNRVALLRRIETANAAAAKDQTRLERLFSLGSAYCWGPAERVRQFVTKDRGAAR